MPSRTVRNPLACLAAAALASVAIPARGADAPRKAQASPAPQGGQAAPGAQGRIVEEVVAVVRPRTGEPRVITLTKVSEEGRIALVSHGGLEAAFRPLDAAALRASLEYLIDQILLHEEAVRLKIFEVDRADAQAALARFQAVFARPEDYQAFLHSLDVTEEELLSVLRRVVRVRRYLESRLGRLRPSDAEAEAWYRAHAGEFGGQPYAAVRETVVGRMVDERADAEAKGVIADLRSRADIRVLVTFGQDG